jgi:hypothetical protein
LHAWHHLSELPHARQRLVDHSLFLLDECMHSLELCSCPLDKRAFYMYTTPISVSQMDFEWRYDLNQQMYAG